MSIALLHQFTTYLNNDFALNQSPKLWFAFCQQVQHQASIALVFHGLILYLLTCIEFLSLGQQSKNTEQKKGISPSEGHSSIAPSLTLGSKQTNKPSSQNGVNCSQEGT